MIFNSDNIFNYGYLIFGTYLFEKNKQYLKIENGIISKNHPFPQKINLSEILEVKKVAGDYISKTDSTELIINTKLIDEKSLVALITVLKKLNLETT